MILGPATPRDIRGIPRLALAGMAGIPLVGRASEVAAIREAVGAVAGGGRRLVVVRGEAGIGKTRLLALARSEARARQVATLAGRGTEMERDVPFAAVVEMLGDVPFAADGAAERWRLHRALRERLDTLGRPGPLALLVDDLHWADPATLEFLEYLIRRPPARPHLLALAGRPGPVLSGMVAARRASGPGDALVLDLGPLAPEAVNRLLAEVPDAAARARIAARAGGNPLLLEELARGGGGPDAPSGVVAMVAAERAALGDAARALADAGAITGDPFDIDLAAAVAGLAPGTARDALDELTRADLVRPADTRRFTFRHPVVRSALAAGLPAGRRLALHAAAAAALEVAGAPAPERARHLVHVAAPGAAGSAGVLREAARLVRTPAPSTAADWLAAARRADPVGGAERAELARALVEAGRLEEALAVVEEATGDAGDAATERRLAIAGAAVERMLGRHHAARRRLERALTVADTARLRVELALCAYERGDGDRIAEHASAARAAAGGDDLPVRAAAAALLAVALLYGGRRAQGGDEMDVALACLEAAHDDRLAADAELLTAVPWAALALERLPEGLAAGRRLATAARRGGAATAPVGHDLAVVLALGLAGRMGEAAEAADAAEQAARVGGRDQPVQWALWMRAWVLLERGDLDAARAAARESVALAADLDRSALVVIARAVLGAALVASGQPEEGRRLLAAYDVDPAWICRWSPWLVAGDLAAGDVAAARVHAERAASLAPGTGLAGARAAAGRAQALLALAEGDAAGAAGLALRAAADARDAGASLDAARALILAGRAAATADRRAALGHLEEAAALAAACGAAGARAEAVRELRRLGRRIGTGGARGDGGAGIGALSGREREIAGLVAQGLTNREIGARIHLSEKTVETHLSRVFAKLGVRGRAAVAARMGPARAD